MILVLAGTREARDLCATLASTGLAGMASLAGVTRAPMELALPVRTGGFGGDDGFRAFLRDHRPRAVIDATHPFAVHITPRTARLCAEASVPCLRLERPGWTAGPGDLWTRIADPARASDHIPPGARVFLATGRQSLAAFDLPGRTLFLRVVDPPGAPFPGQGHWVVGRPPFTEAADRQLFTDLRIDWLVAKDSGGAGNRGKLDAARALSLPVLMIDRPPAVGPTVATVAQAMAWVRAL